MERVHLFISGRVQSVFYRDFTRVIAQKLGLKGWVRNLEDGRVEAVIEGEKSKILELIEKLKEGPTVAKVEDIEQEWEEYKGEFDKFGIRY